MTRIDFHAHLLPQRYRDLLPPPVDGALPPATLEMLRAAMARCEADAAVVSIGPPGAFFADQARASEIARVANEGLAEAKSSGADRLAALGLLPLPDVGAALAELEYALDVLGLDGVMLLSNVAGTYLGDPAWDPLYDELSRRGTHVFLHPAVPPYGPPLAHVHPVWVYEVPFETTRAVCHLIYSGTLDRYPGVTWQLAHMGGDVPFLSGRLASLADREPEKAAGAARGLVEYLDGFYYDTGLSNNAAAYLATVAVAPAERVLFGSDWPYCALPPSGDAFPGLSELGDGVREQIESANGSALFPALVG